MRFIETVKTFHRFVPVTSEANYRFTCSVDLFEPRIAEFEITTEGVSSTDNRRWEAASIGIAVLIAHTVSSFLRFLHSVRLNRFPRRLLRSIEGDDVIEKTPVIAELLRRGKVARTKSRFRFSLNEHRSRPRCLRPRERVGVSTEYRYETPAF